MSPSRSVVEIAVHVPSSRARRVRPRIAARMSAAIWRTRGSTSGRRRRVRRPGPIPSAVNYRWRYSARVRLPVEGYGADPRCHLRCAQADEHGVDGGGDAFTQGAVRGCAGRQVAAQRGMAQNGGPQTVDVAELVLDGPQVTPMSRAMRLPETAVGSPGSPVVMYGDHVLAGGQSALVRAPARSRSPCRPS